MPVLAEVLMSRLLRHGNNAVLQEACTRRKFAIRSIDFVSRVSYSVVICSFSGFSGADALKAGDGG
jgi:hypothetical protein